MSAACAPPPQQRTLRHPAVSLCGDKGVLGAVRFQSVSSIRGPDRRLSIMLTCPTVEMEESTRQAVQECLEQHLKDYVTRAESTTPMIYSLGRMVGCLEVDLFNYMNGAVNLYLRLLYKVWILLDRSCFVIIPQILFSKFHTAIIRGRYRRRATKRRYFV